MMLRHRIRAAFVVSALSIACVAQSSQNSSGSSSSGSASSSGSNASKPKPSAAQQFPFPGEDSKPAAPSPSTEPDAPAPSTQSKPAANAAKQFPYPGGSDNATDGSSSSSSSPGSNSSSSSSSDDSASPDTSSPDKTTPKGPPLNDVGSEGQSTRRHPLPKVNPKTDEEREDEDLTVAKFYRDKGNLNGAYLRLKEAIKLQPDDPDAHLALAEVAQKMNKRDEAVAEFNQYLKLDPQGEKVKDARKALAQLQ